MDDVPSRLDDATLASLTAAATREAGPFVDPDLYRVALRALAHVDLAWLSRVIGRPFSRFDPLARSLTWPEMVLAHRAAEHDAAHLTWLTEQRIAAQRAEWDRQAAAASAAHRARVDAWTVLRDRIPVPVRVCHNWTIRHYDGYVQGADHITVLEPLNVGRLHRDKGKPLCWTPARQHQLRWVIPNGDEDHQRIPTCRGCLRIAYRLTRTTDTDRTLLGGTP